MLYEMARCYDEWPGENYEGSSARGAMKGWSRHGVCERRLWPDDAHGRGHLNLEISQVALANPAGAYYRVKHREIRDVHAALGEVGAVFCTLMVHDGWDDPGKVVVKVPDGARIRALPVISRKGRADDGHAVALVGYTRDGFIVQNSWGKSWGSGGFALLPYEDFLMHVTDVWVAQIGVPLSVDLWTRTDTADTTSGRSRTTREIPLSEVRPFVVDVGNNGELSESGNYWTSQDDIRRLFNETIPGAAAKNNWDRKRVMLYLHGGLNSEADAAKRVVAFRDKCLANEVYPLHLMWETGPLETIGGPMWSEMKENAWRASEHRQRKGAIQLMQQYAQEALSEVSDAERQKWELHVVAHSAGSILFAHAVEHLCALGIAFQTLQLFAPAVRTDEFKTYALPAIKAGRSPKATMYMLTEKQELDDSVGPYGRSLLWLVSNAFEDKRGTPILGMKQYVGGDANLRRAAFNEVIESAGKGVASVECNAETHGGFDNDPATMNSVLARILGRKPKYPFTARDLDY
jgi:hypothetical protein